MPRPPRLLPRLGVSVFLLALLLAGAAGAHYVIEHDLGGAVLCLDPSSVQVVVRGDGSAPDEVVEAAMHRRLARFLDEALPRYGVAYERRESCTGSPDFVLVHLLVFYVGEDLDSYGYTYTVSVQVGAHAGTVPTVEEALPESRYGAIINFIYSEEETGQSFQAYLPGLAETLVRDLVSAWWLDNAPRQERSLLLPIAGVLLALLAAFVIWRLSGRGASFRSRRF